MRSLFVAVGLIVAVAGWARAAPDMGAAPHATGDAGVTPSDGGVVDGLRVAVEPELVSTFAELGEAWARAGNPPVSILAVPAPRMVEPIDAGLRIDLLAGDRHPVSAELGLCVPVTEQRYARGRLALWTRSGTPPTVAELSDPRWKKIALAEPNYVSYGRAANQALEHAGLLTKLMPRLMYEPDSTAALALARDGRADAAFVALSLVVADKGHYTIVSPELYTPIEETLVVCTKDASRALAAHAFQGFVMSPRAAPILKKHALEP